ncbi:MULTISPECIES: cytochrome b [unclassified Massilia]|uniref:cytochrome b n=1 Tax=unclassified Massilia TaxID=2609279 RepID=UPI001B842E09|nr:MULTISPECIES: cytochrome b [unclassified Massilia]MBQ5943052.1 cytochrome b [Massilia sp. AB1]MBQ5961562.1 cytochrome b [Massilia sp. ZL223]
MQRYTTPAIVLHWLLAILIIGAFTMGLVMTDIPGLTPTKLKYYSWHKWAGVTVLGLAMLRLLWRLANHPPAYADAMPNWQRGAAHGLHWLLYLLMFAVPLSGYFYSLASGIPVVYFGVVELPVLIGPDPALKAVLKGTHYWLNMLLAALVGLHVLAAFKHLLVDRDGVMQRMLPRIFLSSRTSQE